MRMINDEAMAITIEEERRRARERKRKAYANRTPEQIARDKEKEHLRWLRMTDEERERRRERSKKFYYDNPEYFAKRREESKPKEDKPKKEVKSKARMGRPPKPKEEKELASQNRARIYYERRLEKNKTINGMSVEAYIAMKKQEVRNILNY